MNAMQKRSGRASSEPAGLAAGAVVSVAMTIAGAALSSILIERRYLTWDHVGYAVMITILLSSYAGAKVAYGKIRHQRILVCLASGGIYWGLLLLTTALLFGGKYEAVGVTLLLVLGGSGCAALLKKGERHARRKKYR